MVEMTWRIIFLGLPLFVAAVAQGLCIKYDLLPWLKKPLDFGHTFRGKRVFGDHKTWRGFVINLLGCSLGTLIQTWLLEKCLFPPWLPLVNYEEWGWLLGLLMGLGMTVGELPNSFLKRRMGISPGKQGNGFQGALFFCSIKSTS
jgi:hypothetical protein